MKEQGEGGKVLFPASLRNGLAGTVSETVAKTLLTGTLWQGAAWHGLLRIVGRYRMHSILI
jgi:hypothetical protein